MKTKEIKYNLTIKLKGNKNQCQAGTTSRTRRRVDTWWTIERKIR